MNGVSPSSWLLPALAVPVTIALLFGLYFAVDRLGLATRSAAATVVDKRYTPPGETYRTTVVDGRSIVQPETTGEIHAVVFEIDGERVLGVHPKDEYDALSVGDAVTVDTRRTRLSGRTQVLEVRR